MILDIYYMHCCFHLSIFINNTTNYYILKMPFGIDCQDSVDYLNVFLNVYLDDSLTKRYLFIYCKGIISFLCVSLSYQLVKGILDLDTSFFLLN